MYVCTCIRDVKTQIVLENPEIDLQQDLKALEVIPTSGSIRVFFDIDKKEKLPKDPYEFLIHVLRILNQRFNTHDDDWAIASCHRHGKISYHIMSRKYSIPIKNYYKVATELAKEIPEIDISFIKFTLPLFYMRLPNQTKDCRDKAAPLQIEAGMLRDFFITDLTGLTEWTPNP